MICTTIQNRSFYDILDASDAPGVEMMEIRLDSCDLDLKDIDELFGTSEIPLVATCRISPNMPAVEAESRLLTAIHAGASYVDLEIEAPPMMSKRIRREANEEGTGLIRSYHDFNGTDSTEALKAMVEKCQSLGADIVKIVTTAHSQSDVNRVMSLYDEFEPSGLIAFCMGEEGRNSRIECLRKGAPFSYAALNKEEAAAPGQWPVAEMADVVYGAYRTIGYDNKKQDWKSVKLPCSKSYAQRAIIIAALAEGESVLSGYTPCGDNEAAIAVARAIGAKVVKRGKKLNITGIAAKPGCISINKLKTGESGFLTRLMIPLVAQLSIEDVLISGEGTLVGRPLKGAAQTMAAFGVQLESESEETSVPLKVKGHLEVGNAEISGKDGSQIISGLLVALSLAEEDCELRVTNPKSIPYLFMTMDVLRGFGVRIGCEMEGGQEFMQTNNPDLCEAMTLQIKGRQHLRATEMEIEADWSAAANFLVAGAVFGGVNVEGLNTKSVQADINIMDVLAEAGAELLEDEQMNDIHVQRLPLRAINIDARNCPDLFPIIAVLTSFCQGVSKIAGVDRLRNKESDRARGILEMLTQMGVFARIKNDTLYVHGHSLSQRLLSGTLIKGGKYTSNHDHRMVMALMVAAFGADGPIEIDDTECVAKSFPAFISTYEKL